MSVATAAIGSHQQSCGVGIAALSHAQPPAANRVNGETGGIVIGANADPALVVADVVDPVRDRPPQFRIDKVMYIDRFWFSFRMPFATVVFEIEPTLSFWCRPKL